MTDRPIAGVLAGVAATVFVGAFSATAVTHREGTTAPASAAERPAPAAAQETAHRASLLMPGLSPVAAVPKLHLPKIHHHKAKKAHPPAAAVAVAPRVAAPPVPRAPVATPVPTAVRTYVPPVRPVAPAPAPAPRRTPGYVGDSFDTSG